MKRIAITLLIGLAATAGGAHAGEDSGSLFACGVNLGGKSNNFQPARNTNDKAHSTLRFSGNDIPHNLDSINYSQSRPDLLPQMLRDDSEHRLPAELTVARVGCSWR